MPSWFIIRVRLYHIIAPTEWNFHPDGVVVKGIMDLAVAQPEHAITKAERFIHAADPCVRYAIEVQESV